MNKRKKGIWLAIGGSMVLMSLYFALWPIPIDPINWDAPKSDGYKGFHRQNDKLSNMKFIRLDHYSQPEHIVFKDGWLFASVKEGAIIRMRPDGSEIEEVVNTGGRPLGFDFDYENALIIADPMYGSHGGILRVKNWQSKADIELLTASVDGKAIYFADALVVARTGKIYFTDASSEVIPELVGDVLAAGEIDILAQTSTGRLLEYDPTSKETRVLMHGLSFANGIALDEKQENILLNETGKYRVWKISTKADNISPIDSGEKAQVMVDNLPGLPDNLLQGKDGKYWIGLVSPRNTFLDYSADKAWLRSVVMRIPHSFWPRGQGYAHVISINEEGVVVSDFQGPGLSYQQITGVTETDDRLYFHHIGELDKIGWMENVK
ncbi:sugar lactone lactonase YvrE [Bacillus tianshenii]|uniref:Sugar lactone lactonase YvrE n=1 Tax=Sutcliffiella tianshenii TaxID=1463404 RepID=A0ABS2NXP8_9BACI|nr:SMP-30/gluconolactonase/LRE family protein [Bacillus tianshenii]MBM7619232.1 sugar lactone lactonase YvrE [Bacillus tianshenii]